MKYASGMSNLHAKTQRLSIVYHARVSVELRVIGHSANAIIVDMSAPIPGLVYDGNNQNGDIAFQSSSSRYCASWHDFRDPESGIGKFVINQL